MGLFKLNEKKIDKLLQKGKIDKIADIFNSDSCRNDEKLLEHAKNVLIQNGREAVPLIENRLKKINLSATSWDKIRYYFRILAELKEYDILNRYLVDLLRCNICTFWHQRDKDIIYLMDILRERERDSDYFQPFLWILYKNITDPESDHHKTLIPAIIDILKKGSWEPSSRKENIIFNLSVFMQDRNLIDLGYIMRALGWKDDYNKEEDYSDIKGAINLYKKTSKYLKKNSKNNEISFLEEHVKPIIKEILGKAVSLSIHWFDIFADNLSYKVPECCAGWLSPDIDHTNSFYLLKGDDGYNKDYINMKLSFCEKCRNLENEIIKTDDGHISFSNILYGLLFARSNKVETFFCTTREEYRSKALSEHLKKMGKDDMTLGIPEDQPGADLSV